MANKIKREKQNKDIRTAIKESGLYMYEVAKELGVNDVTFTRYLRYELPESKKKEIYKAIDKAIMDKR